MPLLEKSVKNGKKIAFATLTIPNVSEFELNGFSLYPNPTNDTFFIKSKTDVLATKINLFDTTGKLILSKKLEATPENSISVANFAKGMYVVTIETTNGNRYNTKLIVE